MVFTNLLGVIAIIGIIALVGLGYAYYLVRKEQKNDSRRH